MNLKIEAKEGSYEVIEYGEAKNRNGEIVEVEVRKIELTKEQIEEEIKNINATIIELDERKEFLKNSIK